ncbi:MAG: phenylalanine--tRNA ligase subunit alpha [Desulfurococcus sp.]|nr:phenylalanine--tRNA ligase subunit alpha [Desulfurococcus sp.]
MSKPVILPPKQYAIAKYIVEKGASDLGSLASSMGLKPEDLMRDVAELEGKGLVKVLRHSIKTLAATEEALGYLEKGLPEEQVYYALEKCIGGSTKDFMNCLERHIKAARSVIEIGFQYHAKSRCIIIESGVVAGLNPENCRKLLEDAARIKESIKAVVEGKEPLVDPETLKRRRLVEVRDKTIVVLEPEDRLIELYKRGLIREAEVLTVVKPMHALQLEQYVIKEFDLNIEPPMPWQARKHPFMEFIDDLRDILVAMGFEEVKGPHVEAEFWNFDALFQAQDHPAREIHDTFFLETSLKGKIDPRLLEKAGRVHEAGWRYKWSPERALRLVLRSQTTAVTVRAIYERGEGEYRIFTIDRNFRPENLDAKHSMEFYQLDGAIVGRDVNFKHLLYFFKELAAALGVKEVWFKPGYFPFTEPSVEGYIRHPKLGWLEVFPGGVFRPEVMEILGAPGVKAIAWGIGVDRLAMTVLGLDDIRLLFTRDLEKLEGIKYTGLPFFTSKTTGREVKVVEYPF